MYGTMCAERIGSRKSIFTSFKLQWPSQSSSQSGGYFVVNLLLLEIDFLALPVFDIRRILLLSML